jgi:hypothetical protein
MSRDRNRIYFDGVDIEERLGQLLEAIRSETFDKPVFTIDDYTKLLTLANLFSDKGHAFENLAKQILANLHRSKAAQIETNEAPTNEVPDKHRKPSKILGNILGKQKPIIEGGK